jgi:hypothetical protein
MENNPEKTPVAQQPITVKGVKRQPLKLNLKKIGAEARVLQRAHDREELRQSAAMWWRPLLALIGAIILGGGGFWAASKERQKLEELLARPDSFATIAATSSGVIVQQVGGTVVAMEGMPICGGDILLTGTNSETTIRYSGEDTVMFLRPVTLVKLSQKNGKLIELGRGNLIVEAAKQPDGTNMFIKTPYAEAAITGARVEFHVTSEFARMEVSRGDIQVRRAVGRKFVTVQAGEYAEAMEKGGLVVKPLSTTAPQEQKPPAPQVIVIP